MPKEPSSRQFRKGTKSCIECRNRKLRCIPADDESQPCQNCKERGRNCVLQTEVGRSSDVVAATSRDRIGQLEGEVSKLWGVVRDLKTELGHAQSEEYQYHGPRLERQSADADSDTSEELINPPTHLQQLFDNEFLDSHGNDGMSSELSSDRGSSTMVTRARTRLQALMPPKEDVRAILANAASWLTLYNALFPTITMFTNASELLAKYEALQAPDASPMAVASLLISISITVVQKPVDSSNERLTGIKDPAGFVRKVTEVVEETIVSNDVLAGTIEGIETSLLYIRLQLVRVQTRKLWLKLRHIIALAELIGLPRAAQRAHIPEAMSPSLAEFMRTASRVESAAILWKSICTVDRFIGTMFNLPLGTAAYPFQLPKRILTDDGSVITANFMAHLANLGCRIQEIDDAYIAQVPEADLLEKVFRADQELRSLGNSTPQKWWSLPAGSTLADQLEQYWFHYFTVRTHLQLALRSSTGSHQHTSSYLTCLQACRAMAVRYVNLRGMLPAAFFAGRVLDLQALTAAIFLLYNSKQSMPQPGLSVQDDGDRPSTVLIQRMVETMDSIASQPSGDYGRQAAIAIRALRSLLERPGNPDSQNLTLRVPMLGKINVNRHYQPNPNLQPQQQYDLNSIQPTSSNANLETMQPGQSAFQNDGYEIPTMDSNDLLSWSLDLMLDDIPPFPDQGFGSDQLLSWNGFSGQPSS